MSYPPDLIQFSQLSSSTRWGFIVLAFVVIGVFDFMTPAEYMLAYLYVIPILVSASFLKPYIVRWLLWLAVIATLAELVFPLAVWSNLPILINRLLGTFSIILSTFFMLRYLKHQAYVAEQEKVVETERNLSQMREDFVATLTHDLKTPLLGEQSVIQHCLDGTFGDIGDEYRHAMDVLKRNNSRQLELVDSLLSIYRNDNVGVELRNDDLDLDELTADILTELQELARERKLSLDYTCQKRPPNVKGDALQLRRVIANVLHNALNYTPTGEGIVVTLSQQGNTVRLEIADNGLGLYLSRQIIQAHRGKIWAENNPSGGCRFCIKLPIPHDPSFTIKEPS